MLKVIKLSELSVQKRSVQKKRQLMKKTVVVLV